MTEENNQAEEQLAPANQGAPENNDAESTSNQEPESNRRATEDNPDWREVRHIMKEQRSKIDNLERELNQFRQPRQEKEEDPFDSLSEDDVVTVADMKKYAAKVAKQTALELYDQRSLANEVESTPSRYSDYYDVIKYVEPLIKENPALMGAIEKAPNPREAAYQMAKMYLKTQNSGQKIAQKIENNLSKPKTSDSIGAAQGIQGERQRELTLEDRAKIWEQAQSYASMR